ncbi:MAG: M56 family metallopeptidase [Armatimonadota bacterium]
MSDAILSALWRASWQGAIAIAILWCLSRSLEKRLPAELRCWLWRTVYVKILLSLLFAGGIRLPVLPAAEKPKPLEAVFVPNVPDPTTPARASAPISAPRLIDLPSARRSATAELWQTMLLGLYLLGVGVCLFRVARGGLQTRHVLREAIPSSQAEAETARIAAQLGLRRVPRLMVSTHIDIPVYAPGTVLLPASADYSPEERRLILAHELSHARRRDLAWEWLGTLTQTIFFFHPLVLLARREERLARESAADALALRITAALPAAYGNLLLAVSLFPGEERLQPLAGAIGVIERGSLLRRRLLALKEGSHMSSCSRTTAAVLTVTGLVLLLPWRVTSAVPQLPTNDGRYSSLYLRGIPTLPLIPLAGELGLSPEQKRKIFRIQTWIGQRQEKILLTHTVQRRQLAEQYLPGVPPFQHTAEYAAASRNLQRTDQAAWKSYSEAMHATIERGKQETLLLEREASRSVLSILSDKQEKLLSDLLGDVFVLRHVGIPVALYSDLSLSKAQKQRIATIFRESYQRLRERHSVPTWQRIYAETHKEALAILTQPQRDRVNTYLQAHPDQKR